MATEEQMCDFESEHKNILNFVADKEKAPKHIRCPKCGRRLKPRFYNRHHNSIFEDDEEWAWRIPPHKVKRWWKKKKQGKRNDSKGFKLRK